MVTNRSSISLAIGLAAFGLGLVFAGVKWFRRGRSEDADGPSQEPTPIEAEIENEIQGPEAESLNDPELQPRTPSHAPQQKLPLTFFALVAALSVPFWIFGGGKLPLPVNLPVSALMGYMPVVAASILIYRQDGFEGVKRYFKRIFDFHRIRNQIWYLPALLNQPLIYFLAFGIMRWVGAPLPDPKISLLLVPAFFVLYFLEAIGEELGWMGYAFEPMENRWGALRTGLILGLVGAVWHIIGFFQTGNPLNWIVWQCIYSVALRVLIVWVFNNTGKSVFAAILVHVMSNISWSFFPNFGSHYDPFYTGLISWLVVGLILIGWGEKAFAGVPSARFNRFSGQRVE